jgi:hypothetical protein
MSDYTDDSDDEGYETVATPFKAHFSEHISPIHSPPLPSHEPLTPEAAQSCTDIIVTNDDNQSISSLMANETNPLKYRIFQPGSPPVDIAHTNISPIDPHAFFALESNRLESFKARQCETFAQANVKELAYVGFYLNAEGTAIQCPWCDISLTEDRFNDIMRRRPLIPGSPLNDEPWTPMRLHRHEIGQYTSGDRPWCPMVRREPGGLYLNDSMVKT